MSSEDVQRAIAATEQVQGSLQSLDGFVQPVERLQEKTPSVVPGKIKVVYLVERRQATQQLPRGIFVVVKHGVKGETSAHVCLSPRTHGRRLQHPVGGIPGPCLVLRWAAQVWGREERRCQSDDGRPGKAVQLVVASGPGL